MAGRAMSSLFRSTPDSMSDKDQVVVEYALRGLKKPIGVAKWQTQLVKSLPKDLKGSLPSIEELEKELSTTIGQQR
jgi:hypothetical protein